ncbi:MAG: DGQHR domain-containing protein [Bacteroidetes bacterium]|nr:DGQHR domain-containing protein [Bacteroidota bacterium]
MLNPSKIKKTVKKKKIKSNLSEKQKLEKKLQVKLHKNLLDTFRYMGFEYTRTEGKHVSFGGQKSDFDNIFLFENLIIICEETISIDHDHLRKKYDFFERVVENKEEFIKWFKEIAPEKFEKFGTYSISRYLIFPMYATIDTIEEEKRNLYNKFKYLDNKILIYFKKTAESIKYSARNEFYKYLDLDFKKIGNISSCNKDYIHSAVIFPEDVTGLPSGVSLVSLVMTAKELIDCSYVFRKESWDEDSGFYYQRLIDKSKIQKIRKYLVDKQRTFIDSIIVSLPKDATFFIKDSEGIKIKNIDIKEVNSIESNTCIEIPYKVNSIGIIDGQHRVFGHHEGPENKEEKVISNLRNKRHLLVTGLFYQKGKFKEQDKRKLESELFLAINSEQKRVSPALLNYINSLQDPLSAIGIAMSVITKMNGRTPFLNQFIISEIGEQKIGIRTPSIVKYGIQGLVEIDNEKDSLFKYWDEKDKLLLITDSNSEAINDLRKKYITFCADSISQFFYAVKSTHNEYWVYDKPCKLLTVTSIVAFMKSYEFSIGLFKGIKDIEFYSKKLKNMNFNFKMEPFPYVSSQWNKLSEEINKCWD